VGCRIERFFLSECAHRTNPHVDDGCAAARKAGRSSRIAHSFDRKERSAVFRVLIIEGAALMAVELLGAKLLAPFYGRETVLQPISQTSP
jgi:hypothetical protein